MLDDTCCILSSQMMPHRKLHGFAVYVGQVVSAFIVGYVHSHLGPYVANILFAFLSKWVTGQPADTPCNSLPLLLPS